MARKKVSKEEQLIKKKIKERERYNKIKDDPTRLAIEKDKRKLKYLKMKEKKIVKPISDLSEREKRCQRKKWRKNSKTHYDKKHKTTSVAQANTPPDSDIDDPPFFFCTTSTRSGTKIIRT